MPKFDDLLELFASLFSACLCKFVRNLAYFVSLWLGRIFSKHKISRLLDKIISK